MTKSDSTLVWQHCHHCPSISEKVTSDAFTRALHQQCHKIDRSTKKGCTRTSNKYDASNDWGWNSLPHFPDLPHQCESFIQPKLLFQKETVHSALLFNTISYFSAKKPPHSASHLYCAITHCLAPISSKKRIRFIQDKTTPQQVCHVLIRF